MLSIETTTRKAPTIVLLLPENSLPNSNPSPMPPMTPIPTPLLSMYVHSSKSILIYLESFYNHEKIDSRCNPINLGGSLF